MTQSLLAELAEFCIRLAAGLACMMVATSAQSVGIQFFRTQMLVVLGLAVGAVLTGPKVTSWPGVLLVVTSVLAFLGSVVWTLGRVTSGRCVAVLLWLTVAAALVWPSDAVGATSPVAQSGNELLRVAESLTSALLLGSVTAAMLLGHSYLIAPTMSIEPLKRLVLLVGASIAARAALTGVCLALAARHSSSDVADGHGDEFWWSMLAARWLIGFVGPAILAWMTWQTARIRSTQSATGILYASVSMVFFGELVGLFLAAPVGLAM